MTRQEWQSTASMGGMQRDLGSPYSAGWLLAAFRFWLAARSRVRMIERQRSSGPWGDAPVPDTLPFMLVLIAGLAVSLALLAFWPWMVSK